MSAEKTPSRPGPPNMPGYRPLRMAAEWASAVRDEDFYTRYDPRTGRIVAGGTGAAAVTTRTTALARRPTVNKVTVQVRPERGAAPVTFRLQGDAASAMFWGESAVEKFLLSYYASAAADDAAGFLSRLLGAWYGYPARVVQVCALVHLCGTRHPAKGTPLSLEGTVGLLCLEEGKRLLLWTLSDFEARYAIELPRGQGSPRLRVPGRERGWKVTNTVESIVTRDAAEFVSGLRGQPIVFEYDGGSLCPVVLDPEGNRPLGKSFVFAGMADVIRPDRPPPSRVTLSVDDPPAFEPVTAELIHGGSDRNPDCVFWSDGAVERFLLPYYASVKGTTAWSFSAVLMGKWDGFIPPAENHPDEIAERLRRPFLRHLRPEADAAEPMESTVFAMTHLPRSEYEESSALESRTVLLAREDGQPVPHSVLSYQGSGGDAGAGA